MKSNLEIAKSYARRGWPVIPVHGVVDGCCTCAEGKNCTRAGKHPMTNHGVKDATTNTKQIRKWFKQWPDANIGIATGQVSGLLVLDVDPRNGGNESLTAAEKQFGKLSITLTAITGSDGRHRIFKHPDFKVRTDTSGKLFGAGLDVLSDGSYFVAPGSMGVRRSYVWVTGKSMRDLKPATLPDGWLDRLRNGHAAKGSELVATAGIPKGSRNATLTSLAGSLHRAGLSKDGLLAALQAQNKKCEPPLSDAEVTGIVESVASYPVPVGVGAELDTAQQLSQVVLDRYFVGGEHLMLEQGRFWHFATTHWVRVEDNWIKSKVFAVIDEGQIKVGHTTSSLLSQCLQILQARLAVNGDPLELVAEAKPVINTLSGELWIADDGSVSLRPHNPKSYLRSCLNIAYDPNATCPEYDSAIAGIFSAAEEPKAMVRHWNDLLGYVIQPCRDIPIIIIAMGRGDNGKTALFGTVAKLLGEQNVAAQPIGKIDQSRFVMASLFGKLMLLDDDVAAGVRLPDGFLKTISESKVVSAEEKFKSPFNFRVRTVPVLLCNNVPSLADLAHGMLRRLMVLPFAKTFEGAEKDVGLFKRIWANELPGVLNRALQGLQRLRSRGSEFKLPKDVVVATEKFTRDANPLAAFMAECCTTTGDPTIYMSDVYTAFVRWCDDNGNTLKMQQSRVKQVLENMGFKFKRGNRGVKVIGLNLK